MAHCKRSCSVLNFFEGCGSFYRMQCHPGCCGAAQACVHFHGILAFSHQYEMTLKASYPFCPRLALILFLLILWIDIEIHYALFSEEASTRVRIALLQTLAELQNQASVQAPSIGYHHSPWRGISHSYGEYISHTSLIASICCTVCSALPLHDQQREWWRSHTTGHYNSSECTCSFQTTAACTFQTSVHNYVVFFIFSVLLRNEKLTCFFFSTCLSCGADGLVWYATTLLCPPLSSTSNACMLRGTKNLTSLEKSKQKKCYC